MQAPAASRRSWLPYALAFGCVLALLAWILVRAQATTVHYPRSDEGYYLHFAAQVHEHGLGIFPQLFRDWNTNQIVSDLRLHGPNWWHPPPYRLGYIVACAWWAKLFGASIASLSWLSSVSHLAWTALNWVFARRRMGDAFALALATLCGFSPLLLGIARLALMDSFTLLWVTASVWLFWEMLEQPRAWAWQIAFSLAFSLAILTKELSVFIALPLAAVALLERSVRKRPVPLVRFAAALALPGVISLPLFALAAGGVAPLVSTIQTVLRAPANMPYAIQACAGPWYRYLIDYLCLSAFPTVLALLATGTLLQRLLQGEWPTSELLLAVLGAGLLAEQAPFIKNVRYMIALELPLRFLACSLLFRVAQQVWPQRGALLVAAAVAGLCLLDWQSFHELFADVGGYDPVSVDLLRGREIIPRP